ncbi:hypothetical protein RND71_038939 [Anisodus tanguticus]|uniref:Uncharacterized protein n=1 Tax=Anisodus tanguticus TaxID=243964 RepID=A0AAE1R129_9SOLA|nr:hypothetical protein RND71_038939 [Anisodus tanguticus]
MHRLLENKQPKEGGMKTISQQQKFDRQEKDERPSKKAEREPSLAVFPDIIATNMPKSAINITKHSPAVYGSSHSSADTDVAPLSSLWMTRSKASVGGDLSSDPSKISDVEDFFARVTAQLEDSQSPGIDVKSPALKMSQYSAQVNKTKAEVQKLLMMPLHKVVLPENYSVLVAALPIYAASLNLSVEKVRVLEELEKNLPSLFSDFCQAKKQQVEYNSKVDKKVNLTGELTKGLELYNNVKQRRSEIDTQISVSQA